MFPIDLSGRTALVTASSRGIGRGIALTLARAGANVAVNFRADADAAARVTEAIAAFGVETVALQGDMSDTAAAADLAARTAARLGPIDILVSNAGAGGASPADRITDDEFARIFDTNVRAYMALVRAVLPAMKARRAGRIIAIASVTGRSGKGFVSKSPAYAGAKGALISYTRSLARECGPFGITANSVCPGWIDWEGIPRQVAPELLDQIVSEIPLGRVGNEYDVAGAVAFLASDMASYITGVTLDVNGGVHIAG